MAGTQKPGTLGQDWGSTLFTPARTPGPLGWYDQGDPNLTTLLGDTPGPVGFHDRADPTIAAQSPLGGASLAAPVCRADGLALANGSQLTVDPNLLVFPGTTIKYRRTTLSLQHCLGTLPTGLRATFKAEIEKIIREMHALGFALGVNDNVKAGYRTFEDQYGIAAGATSAGPGESFHNYLCAVDLGFLQWVDEDGKSHSDYWLGKMEKMEKYKELPALLWNKRDAISDQVYTLSFERIHFQSVPQDTSGRSMLVKCLNQAAADAHHAHWSYRRSGSVYSCTLGSSPASWQAIGTARQLWDQSGQNCTDEQKATIRSHMELAQEIAKTIDVG